MKKCILSLLGLAVSVVAGQSADKVLVFDAASVKVADKNLVFGVTGRMKGGPGTSDPGRITYTQVPLIQVLMKAWGIEYYQLDCPAWLKTGPRDQNWYTITATMPPGTTQQQFQVMLQTLLVERFRILLHHETRNYPGYELVIAPGGSKLRQPADPDAPDPDRGPNGDIGDDGFLVLPKGHGKGVSMARNGMYAKFQNCTLDEMIEPYLRSFIQLSTGEESTHIVDNTGLSGKYDYSLKFDARSTAARLVVAPGVQTATSAGTASEPSGLPDLFHAMEQQLGLRLVKSKGFPLDTIVIDHIERMPIED